jgi:hypothetical protein
MALALQAYSIYAVTSATFISSYTTGAVRAGTSDPSLTASHATIVEFNTAGTISTGDKAEFVASGTNCNTVDPSYTVTVDPIVSTKGTAEITLVDAGAPSPAPSGFQLCYSAVSGGDPGGTSVAQSSVTDVNTVSATLTTEFSGIDPTGIYAGVSTSIQFLGVGATGDKATFAVDCAASAITKG